MHTALFVPHTATAGSPACTFSNAQSDVNATACGNVLPGSQCSLTCTAGFTPMGTAIYTCPSSNATVDISTFTCVERMLRLHDARVPATLAHVVAVTV
jgi:hypothetical protein